MGLNGLALSAADKEDRSAYTHRIVKLAECLQTRSIGCDFFFMPNNPPLDTETTASIFMPLWISRLRKYDFIYCGGQEAAQALFFCKPFLNGPVILDVHGDLLAQSSLDNEVRSAGKRRSPSARVRLIDRLGMSCADHLLTVSSYQTDAFLQSGLPGNMISLVRNGVDLELFAPVPQPLEPAFTFGYFGEFQVWQGIDNLIGAMDILDDPSVRFLLVGFREEDLALKDLFRIRFGDRVTLVDRTDRATLRKLVESVAILLIPRIAHLAVKHAFPTKFAEYAAMGRPILVNDVDETADFVRKYSCGFVSKPSPVELAATMRLAATAGPGALADMGRRSREMAEANFSWSGIGDHYAEVVTRVAAAPRQSSSRDY